MKNWKTTLFGFVTALGVGSLASSNPTIHLVGQILSVVGPLLTGYFAQDSTPTPKA